MGSFSSDVLHHQKKATRHQKNTKRMIFIGVVSVTMAYIGIKLVRSYLSQTFTVHAMWEVLLPKSNVSNCPFLSSVFFSSCHPLLRLSELCASV